jgi:lysophospholipase L1-like esterase
VDFSLGIYRSDDSGRTTSERIKSGHRSILLREHSPNQTSLVVPTDSYMHNTENLMQKQYRFSIDTNGFIENGNLKTDNSFVIAFLGGSTTEAQYVEEKERFVSIVERQLREKLSKKIRTINAGVSGNHSIHSLLNFQAKILPENPKVAILMHNINDFALLSKTGSYWVAPKGKNIIKVHVNIPESSNENRLIDFIEATKNILIPNLYIYFKPRLFPDLDTRDEFDGYRGGKISLYSDEIRSMFEKSLRSFVMLSHAWEVKPILMTQFNRVSLSDKMFMKWIRSKDFGDQAQEMANLYKELNEIIRKVSVETDTHLIDLDIMIPKTSEYIYDIVHLNTNGSKLVGNIISQELIKVLRN